MNWVGGVRNRLKSSHHDNRKLRKEQRTGLVSASIHPSEVKTSHGRKKHRVSQDVLAFRMQSEMNSKNDGSTGGNFRVVNLGHTKPLHPVKNGVNVTRNRPVDNVYLPLSPIETPSVLDLSYSPNGNVLGNCVYQPGVRANKTTNVSNAGSRESNVNSSIIDLFGVPVEKPVKTHKAVSSDESKHKYCVNSDRVCRKASCSMNTAGLMPVTAETNLPGDHSTNRGNTFSSDHIQTFQFTKPAICSQNYDVNFKRVPVVTGSDNDSCFSEPLLNYSSTRSTRDKWCHMSDTGYNIRQDMSYTPNIAAISSNSRLSNTGFGVDRDHKAFEVNLVKSPRREDPSRKTVNVSTNIDKEHQFRRLYTAPECGIHDSDHYVGNEIFENALYSDCLIPNETEFYAEGPDKLQGTTLISSPRSPPKPVFLPYNNNGYSPLDNGNVFVQPCSYVRNNSPITANEQNSGYCCKENREPLQTWYPQRQEVDLYQMPATFNTDKESLVYSGNSRNDPLYICNDRSTHYNNGHSTFSNANIREQQQLPRQDSYIVSAGLDRATSVTPTAQSRDDGGSSFCWRQALQCDAHESRLVRGKTSMATSGENNEGKTSRLGKPLDLNINGKQAVMYSKLPASCSNHGLSHPTENKCHEMYNRTATKPNQNTTNSLPDGDLQSVPLMTSTPRSEQNGQTDSNQTYSTESVKRASSSRRGKQTESTSKVLLEMSMLEKQQTRQEGVSGTPSNGSCRHETDLGSFHAGTHICSPQPTDNRVTDFTPLFVHDKIGVTSDLPIQSSIKSSADHCPASQHSGTSLLNTPVTSCTSNDTQKKSQQSDDLLAEKQVSNTHHKEIYHDSYAQSKEKITCECPLDLHCNESNNGKISAHNPDPFVLSQISTQASSPATKTRDNREQWVSTSSQTTPRFVKDVACSPITELIHDKQAQLGFQDSISADFQNSKVYCLRPRNKTGQSDSVKDTD